MRYVVQLLIPALVIIVVILVLARNRPPRPPTNVSTEPSDTTPLSTGTFIAILVIGATFTVALVYALHNG